MFFFSVFTLPHTNYFPSLQFNPRALISLLSNDEQLMISVILLFLSRPNCHVFHSKPFKFSILFQSVVFNLQSKKVRFQQNEKLLDLCFLRSTITFCVFGSTKSFQFIYYHHHLFLLWLEISKVKNSKNKWKHLKCFNRATQRKNLVIKEFLLFTEILSFTI